MKRARIYFWCLQRKKWGGRGEGRQKTRFFLEVNCMLSSFAVCPKIFQKSPSLLNQRHLKDQVTPFPLALWSGNTSWLSSPASHFSALRSNPVFCSKRKQINKPQSPSKHLIFLALILGISFYFRVLISCILHGKQRKSMVLGISWEWNRKNLHRKQVHRVALWDVTLNPYVYTHEIYICFYFVSVFLFTLFSSVQFSLSVMSDSLWPHELQHARPPCPSPIPGIYSNSCPSSWWCHLAISSSVIPLSSCPQSLPAAESFPMSQLSAWGDQSIGVSASASVLPMNTQARSSLGWTGWISLQSKGLSRVFSNTTV